MPGHLHHPERPRSLTLSKIQPPLIPRFEHPHIRSAEFGDVLNERRITQPQGIELGIYSVFAGNHVQAVAYIWVKNLDGLGLGNIPQTELLDYAMDRTQRATYIKDKVRLGGGFVRLDYSQRVLAIFGEGAGGGVPACILRATFRAQGYQTILIGIESETAKVQETNVAARDWYTLHGFEYEVRTCKSEARAVGENKEGEVGLALPLGLILEAKKKREPVSG